MNVPRFYIAVLLMVWTAGDGVAADRVGEITGADKETLLANPTAYIDANIREQFEFYGLAFFYNNVRPIHRKNDILHPITEDGTFTLGPHEQLIVVGRFKALVFESSGASITYSDDLESLTIELADEASPAIQVIDKSDDHPIVEDLRYYHLASPLAALCKLVEWSLSVINRNLTSSWGLAVIVYAVLLKILLIPLGVVTIRLQRSVSKQQQLLNPRLKSIKAEFKGEEAHKRIMAAHKELGISQFYALKPTLALFIQIPILIATFNAMGEMPQFRDQSFLWIADLAYPDSVYDLSFGMPLLGSSISALPLLMTVVTIISTLVFQNQHVSEAEMRSQKRHLYLMAVAFLILFYPFPAAMVLFWAMANVLQTIQQQILKI